MSREASISMCEQLIAIYEGKLSGMKEKKGLIDSEIVSIEKELEYEKQRLAGLRQEGGK